MVWGPLNLLLTQKQRNTNGKAVFKVILADCSLSSMELLERERERERERWYGCQTMVYVAGKASMHEDLLSLELQWLNANEEWPLG